MPIILGIDPGSRRTGYGVILCEGSKQTYLASGCIRLNEQETVPLRLRVIFDDVTDIIQQFSPTELAVEQVFMAKNPSSALKLGQARGAAIVAAVLQGLTVAEYSARKIKQSVVGTGAAEKNQVQHMVKFLLKLPRLPSEDAADALAAALCHANTRQSLGKMLGVKSIRHGRLRG